MTRFPDFGNELKRPFEVHENCCDCAEFYDGCNAWPASKPWGCTDYLRLPDVMPGTCGQVFPPSRMGDRKEPRIRSDAQQPTTPPVALDGARVCKCGRPMKRRRRMCDYCRDSKRAESQRNWQKSRKQGNGIRVGDRGEE